LIIMAQADPGPGDEHTPDILHLLARLIAETAALRVHVQHLHTRLARLEAQAERVQETSMEPLKPSTREYYCCRCGKPIEDLRDHKAFVSRKVGLSGTREFLHVKCMSASDSQAYTDNLT
jgi:hypothetical protein